jgi:phosphoribosyl 1,2-cyclic phosphodiesterase
VRVRFRGVRGSVPFATAGSIGHGCNTACLELIDESSGRRLILDAGSGIVGLGKDLEMPIPDVPIILTHYHWDHVQGLPFFAPFYRPGIVSTLWAPSFGPQRVDIETIFAAPFFPVALSRVPSPPAIHSIAAGEAGINGFHVSAQPLNHPGGSLAFRVRGSSGDLVYATDHEFGDPKIDEALLEFSAGAAAVVLDAHFTPDELPAHKGWGHSDWTQCVRFADGCGAGHLWLFHHKPGRSDEALDDIEAEARRLFPRTDAASEGDAFTV